MDTPPRLRATVFDFDGTLARPSLDFPLMKRRIAALAGATLGHPVSPDGLPALEWIESLSLDMAGDQANAFRTGAHALIREMEDEAAARTTLFPFARPLLSRLRGAGVACAVITRNTRDSVSTVFPDAADYLAVVLTREDVPSVKPDPAHLLAALTVIGAAPDEAIMVGDHPTDVLTAHRAGAWAGAVASGAASREDLGEAGPDFLADDALTLFEALAAKGWL